MKQYNLEPISTTLKTAKTALILLPANPSFDAVAAGLALYLSLTKKQLSASIGCSSEMTVNFNRLFGIQKIKSRIGNQNLVISFDYPEDSLEKVSYDKDPASQKLHFTIEPKAGKAPLNPDKVEFSYTGSSADLIFVIGARTLEDLGELYNQEKALLDNQQKTLVNLSNLDKNSQFGTVNLYDPTATGVSEIMLVVLTSLGLPIEPDMATNLLVGIEQSTNNFSSPKVTADTFEAVSNLMRQGAKKGHIPMSPPSLRPASPSPAAMPRPITPQPPTSPAQLQALQKQAQLLRQTQAVRQPTPSLPVNPTQPPTTPVLPVQETPGSPTDNQPSPDWLKPKVYKSTNLT